MKIPDRAKRCPACGSERMAVGWAENRAGATVYPFFCRDCGEVTQQYASRRDALALGELPRVRTKTEAKILSGKLTSADIAARQVPPCEVCGSIDKIELHHWAPYHLFGAECDKWPTSYLCQKCHVRWHQIVTPNMGAHPRGAA